ncbi:50S ribosomal protein L1, putative [Eimeria necatrix]|uniref:Ribosomal protein n=1 Tax=Eimeria necatrix TaxID=51315 RepID=U6MRU8_9EIME|nr:50S ribosomal protein L1, putative [Eimeria necatrix]CDJ66942.1 50S ribosomal protein L1, putative [Eimeria necatrix]
MGSFSENPLRGPSPGVSSGTPFGGPPGAPRGADIVGLEALEEALKKGKRGAPDILISSPEQMVSLNAYGKLLGRRNLIPSVAMGTLSGDPVEAIRVYRQPTVQFRADRLLGLHATLGYVSLGAPQLLANFRAFLGALRGALQGAPRASGGPPKGPPKGPLSKLVRCMHVCTTMGPSVKVDLRGL